ncbi:hypothetical protein RI054_03g16870 [Pseudoscourfieldia marina]
MNASEVVAHPDTATQLLTSLAESTPDLNELLKNLEQTERELAYASNEAEKEVQRLEAAALEISTTSVTPDFANEMLDSLAKRADAMTHSAHKVGGALAGAEHARQVLSKASQEVNSLFNLLADDKNTAALSNTTEAATTPEEMEATAQLATAIMDYGDTSLHNGDNAAISSTNDASTELALAALTRAVTRRDEAVAIAMAALDEASNSNDNERLREAARTLARFGPKATEAAAARYASLRTAIAAAKSSNEDGEADAARIRHAARTAAARHRDLDGNAEVGGGAAWHAAVDVGVALGTVLQSIATQAASEAALATDVLGDVLPSAPTAVVRLLLASSARSSLEASLGTALDGTDEPPQTKHNRSNSRGGGGWFGRGEKKEDKAALSAPLAPGPRALVRCRVLAECHKRALDLASELATLLTLRTDDAVPFDAWEEALALLAVPLAEHAALERTALLWRMENSKVQATFTETLAVWRAAIDESLSRTARIASGAGAAVRAVCSLYVDACTDVHNRVSTVMQEMVGRAHVLGRLDDDDDALSTNDPFAGSDPSEMPLRLLSESLIHANVAHGAVALVRSAHSRHVVPAIKAAGGVDDEVAAACEASASEARDRMQSLLAPQVGTMLGVTAHLFGVGLARLLRSRQHVQDYLPPEDGDGVDAPPISNSPTAACTAACTCFQRACSDVRARMRLEESDDDTNATALVCRLTSVARTRWISHLLRYKYAPAGALRLAADVNAWVGAVRSAFKGSEQSSDAREAIASFSGLASLTSLLMVGDDAVVGLVADDAMWSGHGVDVSIVKAMAACRLSSSSSSAAAALL